MNTDLTNLDSDLRVVHKSWGWFLLLGMSLIILGVLAISDATLATLASVIFLGSMILIGGIVIFISAFKFSWGQWGRFLIELLISLLYVFTGILLIYNPAFAAMSLTLILAIFYIALGVIRILSSIMLRLPQWGWSLFSGLIAVLLGILILTQWPVSGLFIIGLFIGIDLILYGLFNIRLAFAAKRV